MMELATNTSTADSRIGIHNDVTDTMHTSVFLTVAERPALPIGMGGGIVG
jgi:hypothetical protein